MNDIQRETIAEVFVSLMSQRFRKLSQKEINAMFHLPALKDTVSGREVYDEGLAQGLSQGLMRCVALLVARKFGRLPRGMEARIKALGYPQPEALTEALMDLPDAKSLLRWLDALGRKRPSSKRTKPLARRSPR